MHPEMRGVGVVGVWRRGGRSAPMHPAMRGGGVGDARPLLGDVRLSGGEGARSVGAGARWVRGRSTEGFCGLDGRVEVGVVRCPRNRGRVRS